MKIDISNFSAYLDPEDEYLELGPAVNYHSVFPHFDLLDVMPNYAFQSDFTLEARISSRFNYSQTSIFANSETVKENLIYPMVISRLRFTEGQFTKRNGWNCYQLFYTNAGHGVLNLENSVYYLTPGSLFLLDCRRYHYFYAAASSDWDYSFIHFDGPGCAYFYNEIEKNSLLFENAVSSRAVQKFNTITELSKYGCSDFEIKFHELMTSLLSDLVCLKVQKKPVLKVPEWLGDILEYISDNYNKQIYVETLAGMAYLSVGRFAHRFKEFVGLSPIEYQYSIRISYAKILLETTDLPPEEICTRVGFCNLANFYSRFKKSEGIPPIKYRRLCHEKKLTE